MSNETLLSKELDWIARDARADVLDSVYCALFNKAGELEGNSAEIDSEWFARRIWQACYPHTQMRWENLLENERTYWLRVADACVRELPMLMDRIASRCRVQAEAMRTLLKAERLLAEQAKKEAQENTRS